jgi:hypothetical protein
MAPWVSYGSRDHGPRVREPAMKPVGRPDAPNGHVRFDERGWETGSRLTAAPAPILDSTALASSVPYPARSAPGLAGPGFTEAKAVDGKGP